MNKPDVFDILTYMASIYPNFTLGKSKDKSKLLIEGYYDMLGFAEKKDVKKAIKTLSLQREYPPPAGKIAQQVRKQAEPEQMTAHEAYEKVTALFSESPPEYNEKYEEAVKNYEAGKPYDFPVKEKYLTKRYEKLPERVKKTVRSMGGLWEFAKMEKSSYVRYQFIQAYNAISTQIDSEPTQKMIGEIEDDIKKLSFS